MLIQSDVNCLHLPHIFVTFLSCQSYREYPTVQKTIKIFTQKVKPEMIGNSASSGQPCSIVIQTKYV